MQGKNFSKEFLVYYSDVNQYKETKPVALLNYLQETAISHSESVGYGIDNLKSHKIAWVLSRWLVKIDRYPMWNEKITIETWPSGFERFYATREFVVRDSNGNTIIRATSLWILIDIDRKRPRRIPAEFGEAYGTTPEKALEETFSELVNTTDYDVNKDFYVRKSDIDTNNHVNNASYADWLLELIPQYIYDGFSLSALEIIYKKETSYGSTITSNCKNIQQDPLENQFIHSILRKEDGAELATAKTIWKKR